MDTLGRYIAGLGHLLNVPLFKLAGTPFTLWSILYLILLLILLFYFTGKLKTWVVQTLLKKSNIDIGVREATGSIVRYVIVSVGLLVILQSTGIDLSAISILAGALGIGVGFGLQNITSNFVSGIIILFERPIKVGDRIEIKEVVGDVVKISPRATTIVTNDNIAIIVPNSEFISSTVTNWSYTDRTVRLNILVGVSYHSDPEYIRGILLEVASDQPGVLKDPPPQVLLQEFGESSLNFLLRVWTTAYTIRPGVLRSELNYMIFKKFKEHRVEIPFPQRDIHIRSGAIGVS